MFFIMYTNILLVVLIVPMSGKASKEHYDEQREKKNVVVVPSHKSPHSSEVIVIGHGSGDEGEQTDKDTISTLSNNILSTTNLVRAQSQSIENLGNQLRKLQSSLIEQNGKISKNADATKKHLIKVSDTLQNTTNLVNILVLMWTRSEKNYLKTAKKLEREIEKSKAYTTQSNKQMEERFNSLEKKLEIMQIGTDNARRLAASKRSRWPRGTYCILANGACPVGFHRQRAFIKTLYTYGISGQYIKSMRIGSSYIGCYGRCGQYGNYATINIATCCK